MSPLVGADAMGTETTLRQCQKDSRGSMTIHLSTPVCLYFKACNRNEGFDPGNSAVGFMV